MGSALTLLQLPFTPRLAFLVLALPIVFIMVAALIALLSIGGRRAWRLLFVLVCVPGALLLAVVGFRSASRIKAEVRDRPELEISREIADLERRASELRRLREKLQTLEESVSSEPANPIATAADLSDGEPAIRNDDEALTSEAEDVGVTVASPGTPAGVTAESGEATSNPEPKGPPVAGTAPEQSAEVSLEAVPMETTDDFLPKPAWAGQPPQREGSVHVTPIVIGPYLTQQECVESADLEVRQAVTRYDDWYLSRYGGARRTLVRVPGYDLDLNDPERCYHEIRKSQLLDVPMHSLHVRLEFPESYQRQLDSCWKDTVVARRLTRIVVLAGAVFAFLATLYFYLRLDLATRGFYTRRLQCGVAAAILALVASGVLLARWIPWL